MITMNFIYKRVVDLCKYEAELFKCDIFTDGMPKKKSLFDKLRGK